MTARIEHVVTSGEFCLDGGRWDVDNNVWLVGDDSEVFDHAPDEELVEGATFEVAGTTLQAIHTPGHSPGSTCLYAEDLATLFSGDTLFQGGPGATGRSYSSFDTIIDSIQAKLLTLPAATAVDTRHGNSTSIGAEAPHLDEWIARGAIADGTGGTGGTVRKCRSANVRGQHVDGAVPRDRAPGRQR